MASASDNVIVNVAPAKFWEVLVDYERYPEFQQAVKAVNVLKRSGKSVDIEMEIDLIKIVRYTLRMVEEKNKRLSWSLVDGGIFKLNSGSWEIQAADGGKKTKATYSIEVDFSLFVPKMISNKLTSSALPKNLQAFKKRAESLHA